MPDEIYNVEVQIKVRAPSSDMAWRLVHDFLAMKVNTPPLDPFVVDFDILEESATLESRVRRQG